MTTKAGSIGWALPASYAELYTRYEPYVARVVRRYDKVGRNFEDIVQTVWTNLIQSKVLEKFRSSVKIEERLGPTLTAREAAAYLEIPWSSFCFSVWRSVLGEPIVSSPTMAVPDILLMFGVSWETFQKAMSESALGKTDHPFPMPVDKHLWASKEAVYRTSDVMACSKRLEYVYETSGKNKGKPRWVPRRERIYTPPDPVLNMDGTAATPPAPDSEEAPYGYVALRRRVRYFKREEGMDYNNYPPAVFKRKRSRTPFPAPVKGGWSSEKALYNTSDIIAIKALVAGGRYKDLDTTFIAPEVFSSNRFEAYLATSVHNFFANFCRSKSRKDKDLYLSPMEDGTPWEAGIPSVGMASPEVQAQLLSAVRRVNDLVDGRGNDVLFKIEDGLTLAAAVREAAPDVWERDEVRAEILQIQAQLDASAG